MLKYKNKKNYKKKRILIKEINKAISNKKI